MKKKKKTVILVIIIACVLLGLCYYFIFSYRISSKNSTLFTYPTLNITQDTVDKINSGELLNGSTYFNDMWKIPTRNDENYGNLIELLFRFDVKRYTKVNDYVIDKIVSFDELGEENIFFAMSTGGSASSESVFKYNGGGLTASTYVSLWGCTYNKSEEEIIDLGKKIKITFLIQHPNGKIERKTISPSKYDIIIEEASEDDIYSSCRLLDITD